MTNRKKILLFLLLFSFVLVGNLSATEEYATTTGQDCAVCHLDPSGGGELTTAGGGFALSLATAVSTVAAVAQKSTASRWLQLLVGYLHILFGFFWFGTILYVHLILKPGYASRGLPRGEVKLGLLSMVIMAISGAILFAYRVPSFELLVSTRFGILLSIKIGLFLIMVCMAMFAVFFLGPRLKRKQAAGTVAENGNLSLAELANYDGKEGRAAYFAYQGEIYDASNSRLWKNGTHMGRHQAGCDLTEVLSQAPHGENKVFGLPKVGQLRSAETPGLTPPQKLFYAMAYLNLGIVLLIIFVLACWKWW
jgi:predicted heme/steroid binding protein/uncharacterized membrane protein